MKLGIILLFTSLLFCAQNTSAADIIVTSNADSGPGTLREALSTAAANGNASIDRITFNMPGASATDHIIKIRTELPTITTDVIIDASTQPGQNAALNGAKVTIDGRSFDFDPMQSKFLFRFINVGTFELYGIVIRDFIDFELDTGDYPTRIMMLAFYGSTQKVILGAPGKGNVIYNTGGLYCYEDFRISDKPQISELIMKSNYFGIKENGIDIATKVIPKFHSTRTYVSEIGGATLSEGNLIYGGLDLAYAGPEELISTNITCNMRNNTFCANKDGNSQGNLDKFGEFGVGMYLSSAATNTGSAIFNIQDNVFGCNLQLGGFYNVNATISRNFFGTSRDRSATLPMPNNPLRLTRMKGRVLVGGSTLTEGNVFTNTGNYSVYRDEPFSVASEEVENIELGHNTFYCNKGIPFIHINTGPFKKPIEVLLKEKTPSYVAGTTKPGARVELYYTDAECTNCQPKRYLATVNADINGLWKYTGTIEAGVSVMASATLNQMSSEFSDPRIYLFPYNEPFFKVTHQTCDGENGTIKNAFTVNADKIEWLDEQDKVIATTLDVENLKAGKYRLKANQFGCITYSDWVEVENNIPQLAFNAIPEIIPASCGNGGSILNVYPNYYTAIQWLDKNGAIKGDYRELKDVPAGEYTLRLIGLEGSGCVKDFGPYIIENVNGPVIDDSAVQLNNATCVGAIGSIKNLKVTGTGNLIYVWRDANGVKIGGNINIDQLAEGTYKLEVYDESACGKVESAAFVIKALDKLELNDQYAVSTPTNCNSSTGSIKGIIQTGATTFKWLDEDNKVVGNGLELTGVSAGTYHLIISNALNCTQESKSFKIDVAATVFPDYNVSLSPSTCDQFNGSIKIDFGTNIPPNQIRVADQADVTVGNTSVIENLKPGNYKIYFKNNGECESFYKQIQITQVPMLAINVNGLSAQDDNCGQGKGHIMGVTVTGGLPPYNYRWVENTSGASFSSLNLANLRAGNYRLTVRDVNNCVVVTDAVVLQDAGAFVEAPLVDPISACPGTSVTVTAKHQQLEAGTFSLFKGTSTAPLSTNKTGDFMVVADPAVSYFVSYKLGQCESVRVPVALDFDGVKLRIPNSFSPNGDGINDVWIIQDLDKYSYVSISVFNRNGQKVYTGNGKDKPFNGIWNGSTLSVGTYYYVIGIKGSCGNLTGSVTILK